MFTIVFHEVTFYQAGFITTIFCHALEKYI